MQRGAKTINRSVNKDPLRKTSKNGVPPTVSPPKSSQNPMNSANRSKATQDSVEIQPGEFLKVQISPKKQNLSSGVSSYNLYHKESFFEGDSPMIFSSHSQDEECSDIVDAAVKSKEMKSTVRRKSIPISELSSVNAIDSSLPLLKYIHAHEDGHVPARRPSNAEIHAEEVKEFHKHKRDLERSQEKKTPEKATRRLSNPSASVDISAFDAINSHIPLYKYIEVVESDDPEHHRLYPSSHDRNLVTPTATPTKHTNTSHGTSSHHTPQRRRSSYTPAVDAPISSVDAINSSIPLYKFIEGIENGEEAPLRRKSMHEEPIVLVSKNKIELRHGAHDVPPHSPERHLPAQDGLSTPPRDPHSATKKKSRSSSITAVDAPVPLVKMIESMESGHPVWKSHEVVAVPESEECSVASTSTAQRLFSHERQQSQQTNKTERVQVAKRTTTPHKPSLASQHGGSNSSHGHKLAAGQGSNTALYNQLLDCRSQLGELESQNALLKFKIKLQLKEIDKKDRLLANNPATPLPLTKLRKDPHVTPPGIVSAALAAAASSAAASVTQHTDSDVGVTSSPTTPGKKPVPNSVANLSVKKPGSAVKPAAKTVTKPVSKGSAATMVKPSTPGSTKTNKISEQAADQQSTKAVKQTDSVLSGSSISNAVELARQAVANNHEASDSTNNLHPNMVEMDKHVSDEHKHTELSHQGGEVGNISGTNALLEEEVVELRGTVAHLHNSLDNLKWGFKIREDSLRSELAENKEAVLDLFRTNQTIRDHLKNACRTVCTHLAQFEDYSDLSSEQTTEISTVLPLMIQRLVDKIEILESERSDLETELSQTQEKLLQQEERVRELEELRVSYQDTNDRQESSGGDDLLEYSVESNAHPSTIKGGAHHHNTTNHSVLYKTCIEDGDSSQNDADSSGDSALYLTMIHSTTDSPVLTPNHYNQQRMKNASSVKSSSSNRNNISNMGNMSNISAINRTRSGSDATPNTSNLYDSVDSEHSHWNSPRLDLTPLGKNYDTHSSGTKQHKHRTPRNSAGKTNYVVASTAAETGTETTVGAPTAATPQTMERMFHYEAQIAEYQRTIRELQDKLAEKQQSEHSERDQIQHALAAQLADIRQSALHKEQHVNDEVKQYPATSPAQSANKKLITINTATSSSAEKCVDSEYKDSMQHNMQLLGERLKTLQIQQKTNTYTQHKDYRADKNIVTDTMSGALSRSASQAEEEQMAERLAEIAAIREELLQQQYEIDEHVRNEFKNKPISPIAIRTSTNKFSSLQQLNQARSPPPPSNAHTGQGGAEEAEEDVLAELNNMSMAMEQQQLRTKSKQLASHQQQRGDQVLNSLLFTSTSDSEGESSLDHIATAQSARNQSLTDVSFTDSREIGNSRQHDPRQSLNNTLDARIEDLADPSFSVAGPEGQNVDDSEHIDLEYKMFLQDALRSMELALDAGIAETASEKQQDSSRVTSPARIPVKTVAQSPARKNNEASEGSEKNNIAVSELQLELFLSRQELERAKDSEKNIIIQNQVLLFEKETLSQDFVELQTQHAETVNALTSAHSELNQTKQEFLSLQDQLYSVMSKVKELELENKTLKRKSKQ